MKPPEIRGLRPLSEDTYSLFKQLLKGTFKVPVKNRTSQQRKSIVHFWRVKNNLTLNVEDNKEVLYCNGKKVLTKPDFEKEVLDAAHKSMGAGARSVHYKIKSKVSGGSEHNVRTILNRNTAHSFANTRFTNKAPIQSMITTTVFERLQIDLVDLQKEAVVSDGIKYSYILSAMDCCSRFTFLRPLARKTPAGVVKCLKEIFLEHGFPSIVQCDNGSEFKGELPIFLAKNKVKLINSSPYHPQSQGKVERNNANIKKKLIYCMRRRDKGANWVTCLPKVQHSINDQPKEVLGYQTPFSVYYGRGLLSADKIRKKATLSSKRCGKRMKQYQSGKSCSIYKPGENVLIKYPRGKRVPRKRKITVAKILKRNKAYSKYFVSYRDTEGRLKCSWVSVENLTSLTVDKEKARRQQSRSFFRRKRQKEDHKSKYFIVLSDEDKSEDQNKSYEHQTTEETDEQFIQGVDIVFNPTRYGNCQFDALAHQLNQIGIHRTGDQMRECAVNHLGANRDRYIDFFRNQHYFDRYIDHMSRRTTYGDHFTLLAITREFCLQVLVISKLGYRNHRVVSDTGVFDPYLPVLTIGHFPEGLGEHYVSVVCEGLNNFLPNPENPEPPEDASHRREDSRDSESDIPNLQNSELPERSRSPTPDERMSDSVEVSSRNDIINQQQVNNEGPLLPNLVLEQIIRCCISMYPESLFRLQYVNSFFRYVVGRVGYPRVHINSIIMPIVPNPLCVRRILRQFGGQSGLMTRLREIIHDRRILNTWLVLVESDINWYEIRNIFWRERR